MHFELLGKTILVANNKFGYFSGQPFGGRSNSEGPASPPKKMRMHGQSLTRARHGDSAEGVLLQRSCCSLARREASGVFLTVLGMLFGFLVCWVCSFLGLGHQVLGFLPLFVWLCSFLDLGAAQKIKVSFFQGHSKGCEVCGRFRCRQGERPSEAS